MQRGKPAKKYSQAGRVHDVIRLIESRHGVTLDELVEETGVNLRTIHRDLIAIQEAGYPLVSTWQEGKKAYRFLTRFKDVPPVSFTLQELLTLYFFRSQLHFLQGTPFQEDMETIFNKVNSVLPPRYAAHMERITQVALPLLQGPRDYSRQAEALRGLRAALLYQYRTSIFYDAKGQGKPARYEVDPYTLIFYKGGLYLLGYARNRKAMRTFAVERIIAVELGKERFEIAPGFKPKEQLRSSFGIVEEPVMPVKIRFAATIAHAVKDRLWHPSQQIEARDDGSLVISFAAGGKMEILSWLLSYGQHAELLEPEELRTEVRQLVLAMQKIYG
jgi:predicted DNA-binding transcriptional regulator YafY